MAKSEAPPRRFFKKVSNMIGITVVPSQESIVKMPAVETQPMVQMPSSEQTVPDVAALPSIDRNAPTLGVVPTTVSPDVSQPLESIGSKDPSMMAPAEERPSLDVAPAPAIVPAETASSANFDTAIATPPAESEPVIVPAEKPAEDVIQAPAPVIPEEPITPTIPEAPIEPVAEVSQPAPQELSGPSVSPTELTGIEAAPIEPKVEEQVPEVHVAEEQVPEAETTTDSSAQEPEEPATSAPEQENGEEKKVKIDPIATNIFIDHPELIEDGVIDMQGYNEIRKSQKKDNLVSQLKSLGVDTKAKEIDELLASWLEKKLAA